MTARRTLKSNSCTTTWRSPLTSVWAKFTEYRGSDEASSPSPRSERRRPEGIDEPDGDSWRRQKDGQDTFLTRVEHSRTQTSERRDGRDHSPRPRDGHRDPHVSTRRGQRRAGVGVGRGWSIARSGGGGGGGS